MGLRTKFRSAALLLIVLLLRETPLSGQPDGWLLSPGDMAPDVVLYDLDGKGHTLTEFKGQTVVLIFWGTW